MLATPQNGWSRITIDDWSCRCSYLDDVPYMLLDAMEEACRTYKPTVTKFDAEGWYYTIIFDGHYVHIITDDCDDGFTYKTIICDLTKLSKELIHDIRTDIKGWAAWPPDPSEDEVNEREKDLLCFCDIFEKRISYTEVNGWWQMELRDHGLTQHPHSRKE